MSLGEPEHCVVIQAVVSEEEHSTWLQDVGMWGECVGMSGNDVGRVCGNVGGRDECIYVET